MEWNRAKPSQRLLYSVWKLEMKTLAQSPYIIPSQQQPTAVWVYSVGAKSILVLKDQDEMLLERKKKSAPWVIQAETVVAIATKVYRYTLHCMCEIVYLNMSRATKLFHY